MSTRDRYATGTTYGGDTYGSATYSNQRPDAYRLQLNAPSGRRADVRPIDHSRSTAHSAISELKATIPRLPYLQEFAFGDVTLFFGDHPVFRGDIEAVPGPGLTGDGAVTLTFPSQLVSLTRTTLTRTFAADRAIHDAIRELWRLSDFEADVRPPADPLQFEEAQTYEGESLLSIQQDLHERAGMRFTEQIHQVGRQVESYRSSETQREATWVLGDGGHSSEIAGKDYANVVTVYGARDAQGIRYEATERDEAAIDALDTEVHQEITDPTLGSTAACTARAVAYLEEASMGPLSGEINIVPDPRDPILPGYRYEIWEWTRPDDADPVTLPVDSVDVSESADDVSGTLQLNKPTGITDIIRDLQG